MPRNEPWSAITHLVATILAIAALVLLVVFASIGGDPWRIVSLTIYGSSMVLLYLASTLYHFFYRDHKRVKEVFRRIDHSMIYFLIAGTYTPLCLVTLRGAFGWTIFGIIWGLAILGITLKSSGIKISVMLSTLLYLIMGWLVTITIIPLFEAFSFIGLSLLFSGGIFYTVGALFYFIGEKKGPKLFSWHEYFHLLTVAGSACHFVFVWLFIL
jgi:hemolysin III